MSKQTAAQGNVRAILPFMARDGFVYNPSVSLRADHPAVRQHPDKFVPEGLSDHEMRQRQQAMIAQDAIAAKTGVKRQKEAGERQRAKERQRFHEQAQEQWRQTRAATRRFLGLGDDAA
jgi:hypothetical protein